MANKTSKKVGSTIAWPDGHFTIATAWQKLGGEKTMPEITLRFRINKAEESKEIALIGKAKPSIGRPKKVYAKVPVTGEVLDAAKASGVILVGDTEPTAVTVAEVKTVKKAKAVVPVATHKEIVVSSGVEVAPSTVS